MDNMMVLTIVLISWFCGCLVSCADTTVETLIPTSALATEKTPQSFLNITPKRRTTSSLEVRWKVPEGYILSKSYLEARRLHPGDQQVSVVTSDLGNATSKFVISDLMTDSNYEICLYGEVDRVSYNASANMEGDIVECVKMSTVPLIRADSLIVLFCVIGYIVLMILIGYLCWRRAHKQKEEEELLKEEESDDGGKAHENGDQHQPIRLTLAPPTTQARPRSAIEDEDIPFITPPWDEIEKEKKQ